MLLKRYAAAVDPDLISNSIDSVYLQQSRDRHRPAALPPPASISSTENASGLFTSSSRLANEAFVHDNVNWIFMISSWNIEQLSMYLALVALVATITTNIKAAAAISGPSCLHVPGGYASSEETQTLVNHLMKAPHQCCKQDVDDFCSVVAISGDAEAYVCGCGSFCVPCHVAGSYILAVHDTCVDNGKAQGYFSLDGTSCQILYLNRLGTWRKIKPAAERSPLLLRGVQDL
ncbi:hypothetical protein R1sor_011588 [Riccia sorocarpa]|uniref:Uncharacterized protein n=1 Tax=Riccia sorocarpa TaxID=122646 RepID=A0ABD3I5A4_9MARC